jgi:hypothetical protein
MKYCKDCWGFSSCKAHGVTVDFPVDDGVCVHFDPIMPMTNADRIRATDDELATMLHAVKMGYAPWCDYHCENEGDDGCDICIKNWLQEPAEGE